MEKKVSLRRRMPNLGFAGRAMAVAAVAVVGVALMPHQGDNRADAAAVDPIRINVGGGEYTDHAGVVWRADAGECDGKTYEVVGRDILNSNEDALFQTRRFGLTQCKVPVPVSGTWKIRLYFAETYFDKDGQREFDVSAEGKRLWRNLDPGDRAGGKDKATMVQASRSIKDGTLDLDFRWVKNQPILSAIELLPPTDTTSDSTTTTTTTLPSTTSTLPEVTTTTIATTVPATVATTKAPSTDDEGYDNNRCDQRANNGSCSSNSSNIDRRQHSGCVSDRWAVYDDCCGTGRRSTWRHC